MKIVILGGEGKMTSMLCNRLQKEFIIEKIIIEKKVPKLVLLKKRIKKLGLWTVLGQVCFVVFIIPFLEKKSAKRKKAIMDFYHLDESNDFKNNDNCVHVDSVNGDTCYNLLKSINPDIVIVNGTRIISKKIIQCVPSPFINMHTGITPKYRGCYGDYWAFYNQDDENAGVTIHFIDEGIDTGNIIYQGIIKRTPEDNCATYSYLQMGVGVELEIKAIKEQLKGSIKRQTNDLPSKIWSHPTIWQYIYGYIKFKAK